MTTSQQPSRPLSKKINRSISIFILGEQRPWKKTITELYKYSGLSTVAN